MQKNGYWRLFAFLLIAMLYSLNMLPDSGEPTSPTAHTISIRNWTFTETGFSFKGLQCSFGNSTPVKPVIKTMADRQTVRITYPDLYHGIDAAITLLGGAKAEIQWFVGAGADPGRIAIIPEEGSNVNFTQGNVLISQGNDMLLVRACNAYQGSTEIHATFTYQDNKITVTTGSYDREATLVIDPILVGLEHATFLGGSLAETPAAIAYDNNGDLIVAANTQSLDLPLAGNPVQGAYAGGTYDLYIAKLDPDLGILKAATYLGGSGLDFVYGLAVDSQNRIIVAGKTKSPDFPVTPGAFDTSASGNYDVFVSVLGNGLDTVLHSTFVGPTLQDMEYGRVSLALDTSDAVLVATNTRSAAYPVNGPGFLKVYQGQTDAVLCRLSPDLSQMTAATFLGSPGEDYQYDISVGQNGWIFMTGLTDSDHFPATTGVFQDSLTGLIDAFLAVFSPDLKYLYAASYYGGFRYDQGSCIAQAPNGQLFVAGLSYSDTLLFGPYAYDYTRNGEGDVFILKTDPLLKHITTGTYIGGSNNDMVKDLLFDTNGALYLSGTTRSPDFPVDTLSFDPVFDTGSAEGFVVKVTNNCSKLLESSFLGGSGTDEVNAMALQANGLATLAGWTQSADFPLNGMGLDTVFNGFTDIFLITTSLPATGIPHPAQVTGHARVAQDKLYIELSEPGYAGVNIYNLSGQLCGRASYGFLPAGSHAFDLPALTRGIYVLEVRMGHTVKGVKYSCQRQ